MGGASTTARGRTRANDGALSRLRALAEGTQNCRSICAPEPLQGRRRVRTGSRIALTVPLWRLSGLQGSLADDAPGHFKEALTMLLKESPEFRLGRLDALVDVGFMCLEVRLQVRLVDIARTL